MSKEKVLDEFGGGKVIEENGAISFQDRCGARWREDFFGHRIRVTAMYRDQVVTVMGDYREAARNMCLELGEQACAECGWPLGIRRDAPLSGMIAHPECMDALREKVGQEHADSFLPVEEALKICWGMVAGGGEFRSRRYLRWLEEQGAKCSEIPKG